VTEDALPFSRAKRATDPNGDPTAAVLGAISGGVDTDTRDDETAHEVRLGVRHSKGMSGIRSSVRWLATWSLSVGLVLMSLRPAWRNPLQGDDMWLVFTITDPGTNPVRSAAAYAWRSAGAGGAHFNPIANFLDALLKGMMVDAGPSHSGMVLHHGAIAVATILALIACADLIRSCLWLWSGIRIDSSSAAALAAVGFGASIQISPTVSPWDPWVAHPIFAVLIAAIGLGFLSISLKVLAGRSGRVGILVAAVMGVLGFLTYELTIVPVAASVIVWAWTYFRAASRETLVRGLSLHIPPLATFVASRVISSLNQTTPYPGTTLTPSMQSVAAWVSTVRTAVPGSSWAAPASDWMMWAEDPRFTITGKTPIVAGLLSAAMLGAGLSAAYRAKSRRAPDEDATQQSGRLGALVPAALLLLLAPLPYVFTEFWSKYFLRAGFNYMETPLEVWGWAMVLAIAGVLAARGLHASRRSHGAKFRNALLLVVICAMTAVWIAGQSSVNLRNVEDMRTNPLFGVDVLRFEETDPGDFPERCAAIKWALLAAPSSEWLDGLNAEYQRDFGVQFCDS
jgi:hypothetical protein